MMPTTGPSVSANQGCPHLGATVVATASAKPTTMPDATTGAT